jgi:hypothetical protein
MSRLKIIRIGIGLTTKAKATMIAGEAPITVEIIIINHR